MKVFTLFSVPLILLAAFSVPSTKRSTQVTGADIYELTDRPGVVFARGLVLGNHPAYEVKFCVEQSTFFLKAVPGVLRTVELIIILIQAAISNYTFIYHP